MSTICFVCNLPILSHQVGLVWEGGNGFEDLQSEISTPKGKYVGRRDSSAQISPYTPPTEVRETSPPARRRRSSLAQLTDILKEWGRRDNSDSRTSKNTSTTTSRRESKDFSRRESLADFAKSLPWIKRDSTIDLPKVKGRRESSADTKKRRQSGTDLKFEITKFLARRESVSDIIKRRRDSIEKKKKEKKDSTTQVYSKSRNDIPFSPDKEEIVLSDSKEVFSCRPPLTKQASISSDAPLPSTSVITTGCPEPQIRITTQKPSQDIPCITEPRSAGTSPIHTSPTPSRTRRDSIKNKRRERRNSRPHISPDRRNRSRETSPNKFRGLRRQSIPIEEGIPLPGSRRGSRPFLSPDANESDSLTKKYRRDSLSPDLNPLDNGMSRRKSRRDSRPRLSPELSAPNSRENSPKCRLRRQSTTAADYLGRGRRTSRNLRSPDSSSTCSSREHSPKGRNLRRQSTTEEILLARGFRRQSTTEDIMRARNFRRQSTQSEEISKSHGRRDSCAQITDGTLATMTIETTCACVDISTQTGKN